MDYKTKEQRARRIADSIAKLGDRKFALVESLIGGLDKPYADTYRPHIFSPVCS
jgi:hypothetical protein